MADMNVSFGLTYDQAESALDELVRQTEVHAAKMKAVWTSTAAELDRQISIAIAQRAANSLDSPMNTRIVAAGRSLSRTFTEVGNVGHAVFGGVAASIAIMSHALAVAEQRSESVRQNMEKFRASRTGLFESIGRDAGELVPVGTSALDLIQSAWETTNNIRAGSFRFISQTIDMGIENAKNLRIGAGPDAYADGGLAAIEASRRSEDSLAKEMADRERRLAVEKELRLETARRKNDLVEIARLEARANYEAFARSDNVRAMNPVDRSKALAEANQKALDAAKEAQDRVDAAKAEDRQRRAIELEDQRQSFVVQSMRIAGNKTDADAMERNIAARKRMLEVQKDSELSDAEKKKRIYEIADQSDVLNRMAYDLDAKDAAAKAQQDAKTRSVAEEQLRMRLRGFEIDVMRQQGRRKEADIAAIQLETEKRILDIRNDPALGDDAKAMAESRLRAIGMAEVSLAGAEKSLGSSRTVSLGAGLLSGASIQRQVFGDMNRNGDTRMDKVVQGLSEISMNVRKLADMGVGLGP